MKYERFLKPAIACLLAQVFISTPPAHVFAGDAAAYHAASSEMPIYNPPGNEIVIQKKQGRTRGNLHKFYNTRRRGTKRGNLHKFYKTRQRGTKRGNLHKFYKTRQKGTKRGNLHKFHNTRRVGTKRGMAGQLHNAGPSSTAGGNLLQYLEDMRKRVLETDGIPVPSHLDPIAPEHPGLASINRPSFLFYISGPWPHEIEFTLNRARSMEPEPVYETRVKDISRQGIFRIDLEQAVDVEGNPIALEPDIAYEWFLTIVMDPEERSADIVTSAVIKYVKPSEALARVLERTPRDRIHHVFAENGYWHCALESLTRLIHAQPDDLELKAQRAFLLGHEQVNLTEASAFDSKG